MFHTSLCGGFVIETATVRWGELKRYNDPINTRVRSITDSTGNIFFLHTILKLTVEVPKQKVLRLHCVCVCVIDRVASYINGKTRG